MNRLREHLLEVFTVSEDVIRKYVAASSELRAFVEGAMLSVDDSEVRSSLEAVTSETDRLNAAIIEFEQRWQQQQRILQRMTVNPRKRDCLQLQRKLAELVRNFHFDANEILKELQLEYQRFSQNDASAEHFALQQQAVSLPWIDGHLLQDPVLLFPALLKLENRSIELIRLRGDRFK